MTDMVTTRSCDSRHWSGRSCPRWHTHYLCHRGVTTHTTIIIIQCCILIFVCAKIEGDHHHHHHPMLYLGFLEQMKILLANQICGTNLLCPHRELLQQSCLQLMGVVSLLNKACPHHQCLKTPSYNWPGMIKIWLTRYAYSIKPNPWQWLTSRRRAEAMAERVRLIKSWKLKNFKWKN